MPQIQLTPAARKEQRSLAHHLNPVVMVGTDGLTPSVKKEVDAALNAHGLIKIRVFSDDRAARESMLQLLADELTAAPIQHIGKLLVIWRPLAEKARPVDEDRMPGPRDVKVLKFSKRSGQRPEVKTLRVLGNQRLTSGGQIKRSKPRKTSIKKKTQTSSDALRLRVACRVMVAHTHCSTYVVDPRECHTRRLSRASIRGAMANSTSKARLIPAITQNRTEPSLPGNAFLSRRASRTVRPVPQPRVTQVCAENNLAAIAPAVAEFGRWKNIRGTTQKHSEVRLPHHRAAKPPRATYIGFRCTEPKPPQIVSGLRAPGIRRCRPLPCQSMHAQSGCQY